MGQELSQEQEKIPTWLERIPRELQDSLQKELSQFEAKVGFFDWGISIEMAYNNDTWVSITPNSYIVERFADRVINASMLRIDFDSYLSETIISIYYHDYISRYYIIPSKMEIALKGGKITVDILAYTRATTITHENDNRIW